MFHYMVFNLGCAQRKKVNKSSSCSHMHKLSAFYLTAPALVPQRNLANNLIPQALTAIKKGTRQTIFIVFRVPFYKVSTSLINYRTSL